MMRGALRWLPVSAVLVLGITGSGCGSSPTEPTPPAPPTPPPPNAAPVVQSVVASVTTRTEVNTDVTVTATVTDAETAVDSLGYVWTATVGTITGTGRNVTWRLPAGTAMTPQDVTITVAVTEPYQTLENGVIVNRQHRVERSAAPFRVHDSAAEVQALSLTFLRNFADNSVTPDACVKDFSDSCPGKAQEKQDIEGVRRGRFITASALSFTSVQFNSDRTQASAAVDCRFESTVIQKISPSDPYLPGDRVVADGRCDLGAIYESGVWKLCVSTFDGDEVKVPALASWRPGTGIARALFGYSDR